MKRKWNKASQKKSKWTNLVENLNSQMRDKISYLVRKSKLMLNLLNG